MKYSSDKQSEIIIIFMIKNFFELILKIFLYNIIEIILKNKENFEQMISESKR